MRKNDKRLNKIKHKIIIFMFSFIFLLLSSLTFIVKAINPVILSVSKAEAISLSQTVINNSVYEIIKDSTVYNKIIDISRNQNGEIEFISNNTYQINKISRDIVDLAQINLQNLGSKGIDIPIGTFSGLQILNGIGPNINIKLIPIGLINCNFLSKFTQAGINQTNHKIYLDIDCKVNIILPVTSHTVNTKTQIMIAENLIIGKVPQTYLYSDEIGELLNLVP